MGWQELQKQETAEWDKNLRMGVKRLETRGGWGRIERGQLSNKWEARAQVIETA